jgi:hypothetical protein
MQKLSVIGGLLGRLDHATIEYCHWKSNRGLGEALLGEGDLDLLIDERQRMAFERLVLDEGFLHMQSPPVKSFPGLADFLGFDHETGELVHLHVHYRLVLGEQRVKNHHLPVEHWLLSKTHDVGGVRVPAPEAELVLLYARAHLKSGPRACLRAWMGRARSPFPTGTWDELTWLADRVDDEAVLEACREAGLACLEEGLGRFLKRLRAGEVTPISVLRGKRSVLRALRPYQRYATPVALGRKAWYRLRYARLGQRLRPIGKKRLPNGGLLISIVGADGSGKSTLAADLPAWLGWKIRTRSIYFGQPKASRTLVALRRAKNLARAGSRKVTASGFGRPGGWLSAGGEVLNAAQWLHVARWRRRKGHEARGVAADGGVAFVERFPVRELWTMTVPMDGPRLRADLGADGLLGRLAAIEARVYASLGSPDHEIVLRAGLATLAERKPETPADEHAAKVEAVSALRQTATRTILDAERPYEEVLLRAKRVVWATLQRSQHPARDPRRGEGGAVGTVGGAPTHSV